MCQLMHILDVHILCHKADSELPTSVNLTNSDYKNFFTYHSASDFLLDIFSQYSSRLVIPFTMAAAIAMSV